MSKFDLLWTNQSPNASFAAQDITNIDLSPYDLLAIKVRTSQSNKFQIFQIFYWNETTTMRMGYATQNALFASRNLTYDSGTKVVHFNSAAYNNTSNSNNYLVPQKMFGVKF